MVNVIYILLIYQAKNTYTNHRMHVNCLALHSRQASTQAYDTISIH